MMITEHPEISLELLVDALRLAIGLGVECSGSGGLNPEQAVELMHELRDENRAPIVNPLQGQPMQLPDVLVVETG